jgi:hypothetical protein
VSASAQFWADGQSAQTGQKQSFARCAESGAHKSMKAEIGSVTRGVNAVLPKLPWLSPSRSRRTPGRRKVAHVANTTSAKILDAWLSSIGLDPNEYGTHTMRRTKATLIYRRTRTCVRFSYYLVTRTSRAPFDISESKSTTRSNRRADRGLRSNRPAVSPAVTNRPGADLHLVFIWLASKLFPAHLLAPLD